MRKKTNQGHTDNEVEQSRKEQGRKLDRMRATVKALDVAIEKKDKLKKQTERL